MTKNRVVAIGDFDGVHLGHQEILRTLTKWAESLEAEPVVLSFDMNTKNRKVITQRAVREFYFRQYGITHWETLPFEEWREVSAEEFVLRCLKEQLGVVGVVSGMDLHFGKDRLGNEFTLISRGIAVKKIENRLMGELRVSSSAIRSCIKAGDLEQAERLLGHPFCLMGTVCHGKGLARQFGTPTVNISLPEEQLLPPFGVYAAWVESEGIRYPAVANIGVRPTVEQEGVPNLEAHLLEGAPQLYGKELRVELKAYLRKEQKFSDREELFLQIKKDGEQSLARLEMLL